MNFFELMRQVSLARMRGKRAWKRVSHWLVTHPNYPSLPGGNEAALEVANHLYLYNNRWLKK